MSLSLFNRTNGQCSKSFILKKLMHFNSSWTFVIAPQNQVSKISSFLSKQVNIEMFFQLTTDVWQNTPAWRAVMTQPMADFGTPTMKNSIWCYAINIHYSKRWLSSSNIDWSNAVPDSFTFSGIGFLLLVKAQCKTYKAKRMP